MSKYMKMRVLEDNIIVESTFNTQYTGRFKLPSDEAQQLVGKVIHVPKTEEEVKVGDTILFEKSASKELSKEALGKKEEDANLFVVGKKNILCILE